MNADAPLVLYAEDQDDQRDALSRALRRDGAFRVVAVEDGVKALESLRYRRYAVDIVLTDLQMPNLDGPGLLQLAFAKAPDLAAVVLSADQDSAMILECLRLGAADYLFKPADPDDVAGTLREVLERRGRYGPAPAPAVVRDADGWVTITAPTSLEYIARFRDFSARLWDARLSEEDRATMRFVIDELGRNAVEWGNRFDARKTLHLSYRVLADRLELRIRDEGDGFRAADWRDPADDLPGHAVRRRASGKRPGGFGIALARKMMDRVEYNEAGNEVVAVKYMHAGG